MLIALGAEARLIPEDPFPKPKRRRTAKEMQELVDRCGLPRETAAKQGQTGPEGPSRAEPESPVLPSGPGLALPAPLQE